MTSATKPFRPSVLPSKTAAEPFSYSYDAYRRHTSEGLSVTEWLIVTEELRLSCSFEVADVESCISQPSFSQSDSSSREAGVALQKEDKQVEVLIITTDPSIEPKTGVVVSAPRKLSQRNKKAKMTTTLCMKCPVKGCVIECRDVDQMSFHFKQKHSFKCTFEGCSFSDCSLLLFTSHIRGSHTPSVLPTKRPRSKLDEEAEEASQGLFRH
jgi:hypothetical protein